jgi:hypothetical protein
VTLSIILADLLLSNGLVTFPTRKENAVALAPDSGRLPEYSLADECLFAE